MSLSLLEQQIKALFVKNVCHSEDHELFHRFLLLLNEGKIRAASHIQEQWIVHEWVKMGILIGFKLGTLAAMHDPEWGFFDKNNFGVRKYAITDGIRIVPGGSSVRTGAFIANNVAIMPPSFVNVGAYVDENTMIDSHVLVGSCAQIGKNVHLSAGAMIGGVLEPINASPVIIEDNVFIGGNCGVYEGVVIKKSTVLSAGVIITGSTPIFDTTSGKFLLKQNGVTIIPEKAVVVPGSRSLKNHPEMSINCPIIIKYRDDKTDQAVKLEELLR